MYNIKNYCFFALSITLLLSLFSCKDDHKEAYHGVMEKIEAESKNYDGISFSSDKILDLIKTIEVTENGHTFLIPECKSNLKLYSCTECHTKPLHQMQSKDIQKAHWDIEINHANEETMNCLTCHDAENLDQLKSLTGKDIDFNNSYKLCSQCHIKQYNDWSGGAHGKSLGSWAPPRASKTCVNCHNPHKPHFESRWPARFNVQYEKERK